MTRSIRTAVTLTALSLILAVMVVVGWKQATAAFPSLGGDKAAAATCQKQRVKKRLLRKEVVVSVYNGSGRKGLADRTMGVLESRTFRVGAIGNAPAGTSVDYIEVRASSKDDPAATLVAQQFKPPATVVATEDQIGPGVNVIMGKRSRVPHASGPASLKLVKPVVTCLDKPSSNPS
jgi:hypothetical protein